jgi:hypothetical protein
LLELELPHVGPPSCKKCCEISIAFIPVRYAQSPPHPVGSW